MNKIIWAIWLICVGILYFFENNLGTRSILIASAALPTLSISFAAIASKKLHCRLIAPEKAHRSEDAACAVELSGSFLSYICSISCPIDIHYALTGESRCTEIVFAGAAHHSFSVNCAHSGRISIKVNQCHISDIFGIARFSSEPGATADIIVDAQLFDVDADISPSSHDPTENPGILRSGPRGNILDDGRLRDYLPGDSIKQIHWKISARTRSLIVRERESDNVPNVLLILDLRAAVSGAKYADSTLDAFLSTAQSLSQSDIAYSAAWYNGRAEDIVIASAHTVNDWQTLYDELLDTVAAPYGELRIIDFASANAEYFIHCAIFAINAATDVTLPASLADTVLVLPDVADAADSIVRTVDMSPSHPYIEI